MVAVRDPLSVRAAPGVGGGRVGAGSLPNRYCDPEIAADLFEEVIDEFLLCDGWA